MSASRGEGSVEARIARAIDYLERGLADPVSLKIAADLAGYGLYHFHRVFRATVGVGPGEYLRMRRLTEAARDLTRRGSSVARAAKAAGYGSAEAFSRAFKAEFSITPAAYRVSQTALATMNPFGQSERPLMHRAARVAGSPTVERYGPTPLACAFARFGLDNRALPAEVTSFRMGTYPTLAGTGEAPPSFCVAMPTPGREGEEIDVLSGIPLERYRGDPQALPRYRPGEGEMPFVRFDIPEGEYLLVLHRGPASELPDTFLWAFGHWLPSIGRVPLEAMDFDECGEGFDFDNPEAPESLVRYRIPLAPIER
jgi:AraC-like DNA-binding protein